MVKRCCVAIGITVLLSLLSAGLFANLPLRLELTPIWPPAGVALFVLLQQGRSRWLGLCLGLGLVDYGLTLSWLSAIGSALGSTIEAVFGVTVLRWIGFHSSLERLQDVLYLIGVSLIAPILTATFATGTALTLHQIAWSQSQIWWYWLSHSLGILVLTPVLLMLWRHQMRRSIDQMFLALQTPKASETLLCLSLLISSGWMVFHSHPSQLLVNYPIEYLPFLFVIWAAFRLGQTTSIIASFLLGVIAINGTTAAQGPFVELADAHQLILLQQAFLGITTVTTLVLAAATADRRRVETLLRRSQASLAKAQHLAQLGNWDFDFEQQQWNWSDELYRLLGFAVQEVNPSQEAFLAAVHPQDRSRVEFALTRALERRHPYRIDYRLLLSDGTERIVEEQVAIGPTSATGTVLDITDYKQIEEKLRLNAEQNRLLSEMALRIRHSLDLEQILNTTVQEVRQLLQADRVLICRFDAAHNGRVIAEAVAPDWTSALDMTSDASVYPEIQALFAKKSIRVVNDTTQEERTPFIRQYHDRYQIRAGIGVAIMADPNSLDAVITHHCPRAAADCHLFGLLIVHQCSHPRQWQPLEIELMEQLGTHVAIAIQQGQLYQQVRLLNSNLEQQVIERTLQLQINLKKLEEMNEIQDVFLHAIAHDLRTTVMGTLMILKNFQQHPGDEILIPRSMLERMTQSGEVQLCKLNSLLEAYSNRIEGLTLRLQATNVEAILQSVLETLKPLFDQNQVFPKLEIDHLPILRVDPVQLERVFKQLLHNAVKHNPPGVQVKIQANAELDQVCFAVVDDGKGISANQRDRLFDLKLGGGHDRQLTGVGVGLCLCQQIIAAHGGQIGVETEPGQGSHFWFTLPFGREPLD